MSQVEMVEGQADLARRMRTVTLAAYFTTLVLAESIAAFWGGPEGFVLGMIIHVVLMFTLLIHSSILSVTDEPLSRFLAIFSLTPLIRILSLGLPFTPFSIIQWLLIISLPLVAAGATMSYVMKLRLGDIFLRLGSLRNLLVQILVALSGLALGAIEYLILLPEEPWIPVLTVEEILPAALVIGLASGLAEELIFRGLLLPNSEAVLGRLPGLLFVSVLFGAMHIGFLSAIDLIFVFSVGFYFGFVVQRTKSLYGVIFAHGLANVVLYLILPFYF